MVARLRSTTFCGIEALEVEVEVDVARRGFAGTILVGAGGLAQEAKSGFGIADAKDGLRASARQLIATSTSRNLGLQDFERVVSRGRLR